MTLMWRDKRVKEVRDYNMHRLSTDIWSESAEVLLENGVRAYLPTEALTIVP